MIPPKHLRRRKLGGQIVGGLTRTIGSQRHRAERSDGEVGSQPTRFERVHRASNTILGQAQEKRDRSRYASAVRPISAPPVLLLGPVADDARSGRPR